MKKYSIAIDGPAGAGKSTIAKMIAKKLNYIYIDTGAMYRAIGYYCVENKIDIHNEGAVTSNLNKIVIEIKFVNDMQRIYLNDKDITDFIRTKKIDEAASVVSVYALVREKLVTMQQKIATNENIVMDGRDIGTVVLPNASLKIFLTASVEERAKRRFKELTEKGIETQLDEIEKEIKERDYRDTHRENSPLKQANDAILVDSSNMSIDEVVETIIKLSNGVIKNEKND